jgi:hypothetical protein
MDLRSFGSCTVVRPIRLGAYFLGRTIPSSTSLWWARSAGEAWQLRYELQSNGPSGTAGATSDIPDEFTTVNPSRLLRYSCVGLRTKRRVLVEGSPFLGSTSPPVIPPGVGLRPSQDVEFPCLFSIS